MSKLAGDAPIIVDQQACADNPLLTVGAIGSASDCTRNFHMFLLHFYLPAELEFATVLEATFELFIAQTVDDVRAADPLPDFQPPHY